jgi:hypothetical protein
MSQVRMTPPQNIAAIALAFIKVAIELRISWSMSVMLQKRLRAFAA